QQAKLGIGFGRCLLDRSQCHHQLGKCGNRRARDLEILACTQGMNTIIGIDRHFALAQEVALDAKLAHKNPQDNWSRASANTCTPNMKSSISMASDRKSVGRERV